MRASSVNEVHRFQSNIKQRSSLLNVNSETNLNKQEADISRGEVSLGEDNPYSTQQVPKHVRNKSTQPTSPTTSKQTFKVAQNVHSTPQLLPFDNFYSLTEVGGDSLFDDEEVREYLPKHHAVGHQISVSNIKAKIGKRLDGEQQLFESAMKSYERQKALESQLQSIESIPKTRELVIHKNEPRLPGPDVYSLAAAKAKLNIFHKGPQTQSTVSMNHMKGERGGFLRDKLKEDYQQNYFHVIQADRDRSSLKQSPSVKFAKQTDRDSTSHMKEAFAYLNGLEQQKIDRRIELNQQETLKSI